MPEPIDALLDIADQALAAAREVSTADLDPAQHRLGAIRDRLHFPEDVLVVALAGGTGSGKSSLFNQLTGLEASPVGAIRPTTETPMAAPPAAAEARLRPLLADMGVIAVVAQEEMPATCLIDLPDTDSVELRHRTLAEQLLPIVDAVVWVLDPEKYRDAALHHRYLRPLSRLQSRFVYALNHADRLAEPDLATVVTDLEAALLEDGVADPVVVVTSAAPGAGPPQGIELLRSALREIAERKGGVRQKLLTDLAEVAGAMRQSIGPPIDFEPEVVLHTAVDRLLTGDVVGATSVLTDFLEDLASRAGGRAEEEIALIVSDLPVRLAGLADRTASRRRFGRGRDVSDEVVGERLVASVVGPVRETLSRRSRALALVTSLELEVGAVTSRR